MLALRALGWGAKRISRELGCSRSAVREYLRQGGWRPMDVSSRASALQPHKGWLAERLRRHKGNADVVRQDLALELGVEVSLRTAQRAVEPLRRELLAEATATVRYATGPDHQLQIDFGSITVPGGDEMVRHLCAATGASRRAPARVPRPHQGQGRARCWPRQAQRYRRPPLRERGALQAHLARWIREVSA